ncbi:MAG: DUF2207 domain-containing protein [Bacteroidaceae bacterium]|nr:DUF2207 domain-containing protein [Bacteroidaceae bacterium]
MKKYRFLWLFVLFAVTLVARADRGGFYYKNFRVTAIVHQDNVWEVTETIDVFFEEPRHGIYRYIPITFSLQHDISQDPGNEPKVIQGQVVQDWHTFKYRSEVEDISVEGGDFTTEDSNSEFEVIRIGSEWHEIEGDKRYIIHYKYVYRDDRRPNYDYLFHTILGTDFNERIENFSFRIEFEKPLPADIKQRLEVYSGAYGNTINGVENLVVKTNTSVITGRATNIPPNHGITLYAKLPEGYYEGELSVNYVLHYICFGLSIMLILLIVFYLFKTKSKKPVKVIEFYPPDGISSAEVGTIIDDSVDQIDMASLIPWLAGQGYISIEEKEKGEKLKRTEVVLTKLKDLPKDAPPYQKKMMELLFKGNQTANLSHMAESPSTVEKFKSSLKDSFKGDRTLSSYEMPVFLYPLLILTTTIMFGTNSVLETFDVDEGIWAFVIWCIPFTVGTFLRLFDSDKDIFSSTWKKVLAFVVKALVMGLMCIIYITTIREYGAPMNNIISIVMFVVCFLLGEAIGRFNVDTDYRVQMAGRLLGFKEFIKTAEKSRLEALQQDDPEYFYKILPYAMVFGLGTKWAKLFKDIEVKQPEWYKTITPLDGYQLTSHMTSSLYSSTSNAIQTVSHDSSSSGGGFGGGGGFSGGGGGGGGGGSW